MTGNGGVGAPRRLRSATGATSGWPGPRKRQLAESRAARPLAPRRKQIRSRHRANEDPERTDSKEGREVLSRSTPLSPVRATICVPHVRVGSTGKILGSEKSGTAVLSLWELISSSQVLVPTVNCARADFPPSISRRMWTDSNALKALRRAGPPLFQAQGVIGS